MTYELHQDTDSERLRSVEDCPYLKELGEAAMQQTAEVSRQVQERKLATDYDPLAVSRQELELADKLANFSTLVKRVEPPEHVRHDSIADRRTHERDVVRDARTQDKPPASPKPEKIVINENNTDVVHPVATTSENKTLEIDELQTSSIPETPPKPVATETTTASQKEPALPERVIRAAAIEATEENVRVLEDHTRIQQKAELPGDETPAVTLSAAEATIPIQREIIEQVIADSPTEYERPAAPPAAVAGAIENRIEPATPESEIMPAVDEILSEEDAALLAEWSQKLETASVEDFLPVDESTDPPEVFLSEITATETEIVTADNIELPDAETARPIEVSGEAALLIEQVSEQLENFDELEPAAIAEAHSLLSEITNDLETLEDLLLELEDEGQELVTDMIDVADATAAIEASNADPITLTEPEARADKAEVLLQAEEKLVQHLQKLCETIGLDYSEERIKRIVKQLLVERQQLIHQDPEQRLADGAESQIAIQKGTHEALRWFLVTVKQLKKRTDLVHRFIGRYVLTQHAEVLQPAA